jgi:hypothetical protein
MSCDLSLGRLHPCKTQGGIKNIYFVNYSADFYLNSTITGSQINDFGTPAQPYDLYKYELRSGGQGLEETNENSGEAGTSFWTQTLTIVLKQQDAETQEELTLASFGRPHVIIEDYNGNFKFVGFENGCDVAVNPTTGTAMGELSGYNLSITAQETRMSYFVDSAIIGDDTNSTIVVGA